MHNLLVGALISGTGGAIGANVLTLDNAGTISGVGAGSNALAVSGLNLTSNTGTITALGVGIDLGGNATINNTNTISATAAGGVGILAQANNTITINASGNMGAGIIRGVAAELSPSTERKPDCQQRHRHHQRHGPCDRHRHQRFAERHRHR